MNLNQWNANLNLHWGKTLENRLVRVKYKHPINNTTNGSEGQNYRFYWEPPDPMSRGGNGSRHATNQFYKKTQVLTDLIHDTVRNQSFTMVVVIASVFLFLTMTITAAVVVFCRKRNTVFALQKSEQEDEYEMEEFNTDIEFTETEFESETDSMHPRSLLNSAMESDYENSPVRRPLVPNLHLESETEDSPVRYPKTYNKSDDDRGGYQKMVVTAVLEKPSMKCNAENDPDDARRTRYMRKLNKKYYSVSDMSSDVDSDHENCPIAKAPAITLHYSDDPPSYDSLQHDSRIQQECLAEKLAMDLNISHIPLTSNLPQLDIQYKEEGYVDYSPSTPNSEKDKGEGTTTAGAYVELPPKGDSCPEEVGHRPKDCFQDQVCPQSPDSSPDENTSSTSVDSKSSDKKDSQATSLDSNHGSDCDNQEPN